MRGFLLLVLVCVLAAGGALAVIALLARDDNPPAYGPVTLDPDEPDPFAWESGREEDFVERATVGHSHVLYEKSPGGVFASARRVERWRLQIEQAAADAGVDADVLEAMVFLESAGYPDARAGDLEGAVGLTQILAETATSFLGMKVDLAASERLTRQIRRRGPSPVLLARRRKVDERFDPDKALAAAGRYLDTAEQRFGREDLAVASYHMGIGNLEQAIRDYADDRSTPVAQLVRSGDISYARLFFDTSPLRDADAWRTLSDLSDDSKTYYWRVLAAERIMRLYRSDPDRLETIQELQDNKGSSEEVMHPPGTTTRFTAPSQIRKAIDAGDLRALPTRGTRRLGFVVDAQMGQLARKLGTARSTYRALRPEALALLVYLAAGTKAIDPRGEPLRITSTVRDQRYQGLLLQSNPEATAGYSLHTTGFAFDALRRYRDRRQARAFEFLLDRLQALDLIAWVREPAAIHITVSSGARRLLALLDRLPASGG